MCAGLSCLIDLMLHLGIETARDDLRRRLGENTLDNVGLFLVRYVDDSGSEVIEDVFIGFR